MSELKAATLVTGATSGIGREIAHLVAKPGIRIVAVGRRADRLLELETFCLERGTEFLGIPLDLTSDQAVESLMRQIADQGWWVETLFNNAGFGKIGSFAACDWQVHQQMIRLNMEAASHLTHACLPAMLEHRSGHLIQISSLAGFTPGPFQATYYATKAFFSSLSMALERELIGTGVQVTTVCPGPTKSEFREIAGIVGEGEFPKRMTALEVAQQCVQASGGLLVPGLSNRILVTLLQLLPIGWKARILDRLGRKRSRS